MCLTSQLEDLKQFVIILFIFIIAYGIALQAVSFPGPGQYSKSFGEVIRGILDLPYWQMYGELFLEEISGRSDWLHCLITSQRAYGMGGNKGMKKINSLPLSSFVITYTDLQGKPLPTCPAKP